MNPQVHYEFTRRWAIEEGFSQEDAETIARADNDVDRVYQVHENWHNKGYHFAWLGANRRAKLLSKYAVAHGDLRALGEALHCVQDAIGHGQLGHIVHWEGIDRWDQRGPRVRARLERRSREVLAGYLRARESR